MQAPKDKNVRSSRIGRLAQLGGMAARLAGDAAKAAGQLAVTVSSDKAKERLHASASKTLFRHLSEMKGLPMKVGQLLSYIEDLVPAEHRDAYREALSELQTRSRPMLWQSMETQFVEDLGRSVDDCFAHFDKQPIAAASIGQVYRARTHDGQDVAVKIQYPGIAEAIDSDLRNLDSLVRALSVVIPKVDVQQSLEDIAGRVREECDYVAEFENQQYFSRSWSGHESIYIPAPIPELSGRRVLTSPYVEGQSWSDMMASSTPEDRQRYGLTIFQFVFRSMYIFERFNGDPHPGNYLFLGEGKVAFLDFGCVQRYDRDTLIRFSRARSLASKGIRGPEFRKAAVQAYGLPEHVDQELWNGFEDYLYLSFEPLLAPQPYQYSPDFTAKLAQATSEMRRMVTRKLLTAGVFDTKRPGAVFLHRINFGLNSILAQLGAKGDWPAHIDEIYEEGGFTDALINSEKRPD
ncbi:MAG TPA: hypothetical protein DCQ06_02735 [Myxococcales bacterium]|nr:hypothetical protein [Myxococcales bacterium]HAN30490.1 hypothetical protein [Myxococcales bacterium]